MYLSLATSYVAIVLLVVNYSLKLMIMGAFRYASSRSVASKYATVT